ncbi:unnamed protein product, partial [Phaeothamnion confervicola]
MHFSMLLGFLGQIVAVPFFLFLFPARNGVRSGDGSGGRGTKAAAGALGRSEAAYDAAGAAPRSAVVAQLARSRGGGVSGSGRRGGRSRVIAARNAAGSATAAGSPGGGGLPQTPEQWMGFIEQACDNARGALGGARGALDQLRRDADGAVAAAAAAIAAP